MEFDVFAKRYEAALAEGLSVTGEDSAYYAKGRIDVLTSMLDQRDPMQIRRILDFGCGTGGSCPWVTQKWPHADYVGYDVSEDSLAVARQRYKNPKVSWTSEAGNLGLFDLVLTNGVFHHIELAGRSRALDVVRRSMRADGAFAFFENNPWNPGTRYIMSRVEFDRGAILISPRQAKLLLKRNDLEPQRFAALFYFPAALSFLRLLERTLRRVPLGGQYLYVCKKIAT